MQVRTNADDWLRSGTAIRKSRQYERQVPGRRGQSSDGDPLYVREQRPRIFPKHKPDDGGTSGSRIFLLVNKWQGCAASGPRLPVNAIKGDKRMGDFARHVAKGDAEALGNRFERKLVVRMRDEDRARHLRQTV